MFEDPYDIQNALLTGYPYDVPPLICPVCGEENPDWAYYRGGYLIGCDCCIERFSADACDEFHQN